MTFKEKIWCECFIISFSYYFTKFNEIVIIFCYVFNWHVISSKFHPSSYASWKKNYFLSWTVLVMTSFIIVGIQWLTIHRKDLECLWMKQSRWIGKKYSNVKLLEVYLDILFNVTALFDRMEVNERNVVIHRYQVNKTIFSLIIIYTMYSWANFAELPHLEEVGPSTPVLVQSQSFSDTSSSSSSTSPPKLSGKLVMTIIVRKFAWMYFVVK